MRFASQTTCLAVLAFVIATDFNVVLGETSNDEAASPETLEQLNFIEESVNHTADPCEDFFNYACGNWAQGHPYFTQRNMNRILRHGLQEKVSQMWPQLPSWEQEISEHNQTYVEKTLAFNRSCFSRRETIGYFSHIKPGNDLEWPLIFAFNNEKHPDWVLMPEMNAKEEEQNFDSFDVFALLGKLFSYGMNNVIIKSSVERMENRTLHIKLSLPTVRGKSERFIIADLLYQIGFKYFTFPMQGYINLMTNIQIDWDNLSNAYAPDNTNEDVLTYGQVKDVMPKLARFLENMLSEYIHDDDIIQLTNVNYLKFIQDKEFKFSDAQNLCNYVMLKFYNYLQSEVSGDCDETILTFMNLAVNFLFYQTYMKPHENLYHASVEAFLKGLTNQTMALVDENNLKFTDNMIEAIKEKLGKLHITIGNLPENVDVAKVEEFYSDLPDLDPNDYYQNVLYILRHNYYKSFDCPKYMKCIGTVGPVTESIPEDDLMIVPFASLTPPMYHWNFDPLFTVSSLGTLIGHEITHSMDTSALTSESIYPSLHEDFNNHPELNEATECMMEQKYTKDIRERVADFAGAHIAFQFYAMEYNTQPKFSKMSWQQLFFLNMAQSFCQETPILDNLRADERLRQIAMNSREFAAAFECPVGSSMNPAKKCRFY